MILEKIKILKYNSHSFIVICEKLIYEDFFIHLDGEWNKDGFITKKENLHSIEKLVKYFNKHEQDILVNYNNKQNYQQKKKKKNDQEENPLKYYETFTLPFHEFKKVNKIVEKEDNSSLLSLSSSSQSSSSSTSSSSINSKYFPKKLSKNSNNTLSSSSYCSSSSDGFPSPETPKRYYSINDLLDMIKHLEKRIYILEKKI